MFDESYMECYAEWAEQELVWGKGMYNWGGYKRAYEEDEKPKKDIDYDYEIPF